MKEWCAKNQGTETAAPASSNAIRLHVLHRRQKWAEPSVITDPRLPLPISLPVVARGSNHSQQTPSPGFHVFCFQYFACKVLKGIDLHVHVRFLFSIACKFSRKVLKDLGLHVEKKRLFSILCTCRRKIFQDNELYAKYSGIKTCLHRAASRAD